jgi:hypothetical protein
MTLKREFDGRRNVMKLASFVIAFAAIPTVSLAQSSLVLQHDGVQGVNWDAVEFVVDGGHSAIISVDNITTATGRGNDSFVEVYVNGEHVSGRDQHTHYSKSENDSVSLVKREPGHYVIEVDCGNHMADAKSCIIDGKGVSIIHIH